MNLGAAMWASAREWRIEMIVYLTGSPDKPPGAKHFMSCSPAGHLPHQYTQETDNGVWWDKSTIPARPRNFDLIFDDGACVVTQPGLGEYLVTNGFAVRHRPILRRLLG
jgi:hypothetical protein